MNWLQISRQEGLSEEFMIEHQKNLRWSLISLYQNLSESMIERFGEHVDWDFIAEHQNISLEFIEKHKNRLPLFRLQINKHLIPYEKKINTLYKEQNKPSHDVEDILDNLLDGLS